MVRAVLAGASVGQLGITRQRHATITALARAVDEQRLQLNGGTDVPATVAFLKTLPGVGDWTAQYIAMRALRWPDAFRAGDVALHKALGAGRCRRCSSQRGRLKRHQTPGSPRAVRPSSAH